MFVCPVLERKQTDRNQGQEGIDKSIEGNNIDRNDVKSIILREVEFR